MKIDPPLYVFMRKLPAGEFHTGIVQKNSFVISCSQLFVMHAGNGVNQAEVMTFIQASTSFCSKNPYQMLYSPLVCTSGKAVDHLCISQVELVGEWLFVMNEHPRPADDKSVSREKYCNALKGKLAPFTWGMVILAHASLAHCMPWVPLSLQQGLPTSCLQMGKAGILLMSNMDRSVHWKQGGFI